MLFALSFVSCDKDKNSPDNGITLESGWDKAVKEHPFLANFPKYDYDFQGTYSNPNKVETYMIVDRKSEEKKFTEYKAKLEKAGFTVEKELSATSVTYTKTTDAGETLQAFINYSAQMLSINFTLLPKDW